MLRRVYSRWTVSGENAGRGDLAAARQGIFREDLYHRLNVVALLRDRVEDIPALARHFLELACARGHRRVTSISAETERYLKA